MQLKSKCLVSFFTFFLFLNINFNSLLCFSFFEDQISCFWNKIFALNSVVILFRGDVGIIFNSNCSIRSISSCNDNVNFFIASNCFDHIVFIELDLTRLVIINNSNSCFGVLASQLDFFVNIEKLYPEIFIRLPVLVIINEDLNNLKSLAVLEVDGLNQFFVIFSSLSLVINSFDQNLALSFLLIHYLDANAARCFRN